MKPETKKRRLLDAGGPVEEEEAARQKMRDADVSCLFSAKRGFDVDDVTAIKNWMAGSNKIRAMGYFAEKGDLPMMRWLYVNGADTRDLDVNFYFPMIRAAISAPSGNIEACKWLFEHGAAEDIKRRTVSKCSVFGVGLSHGLSPLHFAFADGKRELSRWLLLNGALCKDDESGDLDLVAMKKDLGGSQWSPGQSITERGLLLEWTNELHQTRASFLTFLMGTLSPPEYSASSLRKLLLEHLSSKAATDRLLLSLPSDQHRRLWDEILLAKQRPSPANLLNGTSGILELIFDYVGVMRGREARIIRQLSELLPAINKELDAKHLLEVQKMEGSAEHTSSDEDE